MVDGDLFDKLEYIARTIRNVPLPFGGIQLVLCGDFMQLPPVGKLTKFSFEAKTWNECITTTIQLKHVFRQNDPVFIGILNEMRTGKMSPESVSKLQSLSRELRYTDGIEPTEL